MTVKTGKVLGMSVGLFLASSMIIFISAWMMFIAWIFVLLGLLAGKSLDRQDKTPEVPWKKYIIIAPTVFALAVAIPFGMRYAEFSYLASQLPKHPGLKLIEKSWGILSGDGPAGFSELYTTTESPDVVYNYYVNELKKRGWRVGKKQELWQAGKHSNSRDKVTFFIVKFRKNRDTIWLIYGAPYIRNIDIPIGTYPVSISYQRQSL